MIIKSQLSQSIWNILDGEEIRNSSIVGSAYVGELIFITRRLWPYEALVEHLEPRYCYEYIIFDIGRLHVNVARPVPQLWPIYVFHFCSEILCVLRKHVMSFSQKITKYAKVHLGPFIPIQSSA